MQENRRDIESAPKYTATEEDNATLNDEKLVEEQGQGTGEHKVKAVDVLRKAPGIDGDEALKALELEEGEVITIDEETNRRLLRKIDWHVMPLLCIIYGLQYLDSRSTLSKYSNGRNNPIVCFDHGSAYGYQHLGRPIQLARFHVLLWLPRCRIPG